MYEVSNCNSGDPGGSVLVTKLEDASSPEKESSLPWPVGLLPGFPCWALLLGKGFPLPLPLPPSEMFILL